MGVPGSLAEWCEDAAHAHEEDSWDEREERSWTAYYAREARSRRSTRQRVDERHAVPLVQRLRDSGVFRASDGAMSIRTPEIDDAHEAADALEVLLAIADRLASSDAESRRGAMLELSALRARISGELERFDDAAARLFGPVREAFTERRRTWEREHGEVDDEDAAYLFELPVVCVEHRRFIPCRTCMYHSPAVVPYSDAKDDVAAVRAHHTG